jgi:oxygen-dependent protoporphyrinogen oxidase
VRATYCVVGGGISGLVAAYRLRQASGPDASITLFDPADRLGGVLRTERIGNQYVDVGAEAFVARRPEVPALLSELGLAARQVGTTGVRPLIFSGERLHPMPQGTLQGIPADASSVMGLVDAATVAQIGGERERPFSWRPGADLPVGSLVGDRFGAQVVARSVDPLLAGVYAGSAATIGVRSAVPTLAAALDRGARNLTDAVRQALPPPLSGSVFGAVDGGYRVLVDELVRRAHANWAHVAVERVERAADGWTVVDDEGACWHADAVVFAVPAPRLPRMLERVAPRTASAARRIQVASASRKWGARGNVELVRLSFGRFGDELARSVGDEELLKWASDDLSTVFGVNVDPVDCHVQRWLDAMPQYGPGHLDLVAELRAGLPPGLAVAGGYLDGIGVPACVGSGTRAAAEVASGR